VKCVEHIRQIVAAKIAKKLADIVVFAEQGREPVTTVVSSATRFPA
jgi:hypothetical protein